MFPHGIVSSMDAMPQGSKAAQNYNGASTMSNIWETWWRLCCVL